MTTLQILLLTSGISCFFGMVLMLAGIVYIFALVSREDMEVSE
jgi:hypothetical protein